MADAKGGGAPQPKEATQFEYAWKWFELHANQRVQMVSFFIIFVGIMVNGYYLMLEKKNYDLAAAIGVIGLFLSFCFIFLDQRNRDLLKRSENILAGLEETWLFAGNQGAQFLLHDEGVNEDKSIKDCGRIMWWYYKIVKHTFAILAIEALIAYLSLGAVIYAHLRGPEIAVPGRTIWVYVAGSVGLAFLFAFSQTRGDKPAAIPWANVAFILSMVIIAILLAC